MGLSGDTAWALTSQITLTLYSSDDRPIQRGIAIIFQDDVIRMRMKSLQMKTSRATTRKTLLLTQEPYAVGQYPALTRTSIPANLDGVKFSHFESVMLKQPSFHPSPGTRNVSESMLVLQSPYQSRFSRGNICLFQEKATRI